MKVGIFTLPLHVNYGGIMQAYALQEAIKSCGHDVFLLDRDKFFIPLSERPKIYIKRAVKKYLLRKNEIVFAEKKQKEDYLLVSTAIREFIDKYITSRVMVKSLNKLNMPLDAIVVGSDQVWRPRYMRPIENAFLDFTDGMSMKRLSYAASFGSEKWEYSAKQTDNCKKLVQRFNQVGVREESGVEMCHRYLNASAVHVLDPTMLLTRADYEKIIQAEKEPDLDGELLHYVLDQSPSVTTTITEISRFFDCKVFSCVTGDNIEVKSSVKPKVSSWLNSFKQAKCVVTDSFHGMVFSILFNKPFWVLVNEDRGRARFTSLLKILDLEDRIVDSSKALRLTGSLATQIDWNKVNTLLAEKRAFSMSFLKENLSGE